MPDTTQELLQMLPQIHSAPKDHVMLPEIKNKRDVDYFLSLSILHLYNIQFTTESVQHKQN